MKMTVEEFVNNLASVGYSENVDNPYQNDLQRTNLVIYLNYYVENPPDCLFVGEAPGRRGCAITGIPFADEH